MRVLLKSKVQGCEAWETGVYLKYSRISKASITQKFAFKSARTYPKNEINIPAATAEPITPATLDDIQ